MGDLVPVRSKTRRYCEQLSRTIRHPIIYGLSEDPKMPQTDITVSVIILNWNGGAQTCIDAVASAVLQDYCFKEIIFVDNGSTDGSLEAIHARFPDIHIVPLESNRGTSVGRNIGAQKASGDLLFFLENDGVWATHDVIREAVSLFATYPDIGAAYTKVEGYSTGVSDPPLDLNTPQQASLALASSFRGGAAIIRRHLFDEAGGFPSDFFRQGEEQYLSILIYSAGYKIVYWPAKTMRHKGSDYSGKSSQVRRLSFENDLKTVRRLYPRRGRSTLLAVKLASGLFRFLRGGAITEYVTACKSIFTDPHTTDNHVSSETMAVVEAIRFGNIDAAAHVHESLTQLKEICHGTHSVLTRMRFHGSRLNTRGTRR